MTAHRSAFTTNYYLLVVVFLIFDVELTLLFPTTSLYQATGRVIGLTLMPVITLLLVGVLHEKKEGTIQ